MHSYTHVVPQTQDQLLRADEAGLGGVEGFLFVVPELELDEALERVELVLRHMVLFRA